ncbi:MAG: DUF4282 domain-containing protein [Armatimonadota bacterium]
MDNAFTSVKEFFVSLFDFSFKEFLTDKVIKILYVFAAIYIAINCVIILVASFKLGAGQAFLTFFYVILRFVILMMLARAFLEIVIMLFRIAENTEVLAGRIPRTTPMDDGVVVVVESKPAASVITMPDSEPCTSDTQPETPAKKPSRKRSA